jgi:hypothetical protein
MFVPKEGSKETAESANVSDQRNQQILSTRNQRVLFDQVHLVPTMNPDGFEHEDRHNRHAILKRHQTGFLQNAIFIITNFSPTQIRKSLISIY